MSRYFYIIYLLICTEWICCLAHNRNSNSRHIDRRDRRTGRRRQSVDYRRNKQDDREPIAQFDVASFIQSRDDEAEKEINPYSYRDKKESRTSKESNDYGPLIDNNAPENIIKRDKGRDYLSPGENNAAELNLTPQQFRDTINDRRLNLAALPAVEDVRFERKRDDPISKSKTNDELTIGNDLIPKSEKKCSFKNMKIPFFSRNKSENGKKEKKRKLFCFDCSKKEDSARSVDAYEARNMNKRSYEEKLCPKCKRKFGNRGSRRRHVTAKLIHNSRQFYEDLNNRATSKPKSPEFFNSVKKSNSRADPVKKKRRKREDVYNERNLLKELDVIQRKIDNVEINMPNVEKSES